MVLVMDEDIKEIQGEVPCCMMFASDVVLVEENLEEVNYRLDSWRLVLEGKALRINRNNIEYMEYEFGGRDQKLEGTRRAMTIRGYMIGEVKNFKYLESHVQKGWRLWYGCKTGLSAFG